MYKDGTTGSWSKLEVSLVQLPSFTDEEIKSQHSHFHVGNIPRQAPHNPHQYSMCYP